MALIHCRELQTRLKQIRISISFPGKTIMPENQDKEVD